MDKREKLEVMEKIVRQLDDLVNSQTAILKKVALVEAENINHGDRLLEKQLPEIYSGSEEMLNEVVSLAEEFTAARDKFIKDNKLEEVPVE
ncbi:MAG: hypothetical protein ABIO82_03225 [Ginsengibacter sp.]